MHEHESPGGCNSRPVSIGLARSAARVLRLDGRSAPTTTTAFQGFADHGVDDITLGVS